MNTKTSAGYFDDQGRECHPDLGKQSDLVVDVGEPQSSLSLMVDALVNAALARHAVKQSPGPLNDDDLDWEDEPDYSTFSAHSLDLQEAALSDELDKIAEARAKLSASHEQKPADTQASPPTKVSATPSVAVPASGDAGKPQA